MNNFEAKYIKISAKYLDEKLKKLNIKPKQTTQASGFINFLIKFKNG